MYKVCEICFFRELPISHKSQVWPSLILKNSTTTNPDFINLFVYKAGLSQDSLIDLKLTCPTYCSLIRGGVWMSSFNVYFYIYLVKLSYTRYLGVGISEGCFIFDFASIPSIIIINNHHHPSGTHCVTHSLMKSRYS